MSESLNQFIMRRRAELEAAEEALRAQIREIANEREQLRKAAIGAGLALESILDRDEHRETPTKPLSPPRSQKRASEKTIKEAVVALLKRYGRGMTALEILPEINAALNVDYPRTSLSPQLSRLKADGIVMREGNVWSLVEWATGNDEASDNAPMKESSEASDNPGVFE
ncbi:hypothetical protein FZC33_21660 [Labrys sp. KNU-23]|uniref:hypothetical protein n=1 Tax=Labrys sp. KNU-23 TaxID=2789216 RepID=UPI0011ED614C|nr:hypothetical protein [Labrys sp. KNU-23]QEN88747.1 hypothetical protein FZC33_21660 [Labrys sp. KNU-23]